MTTIFTSLSSFFIDNANVSRLQGDFEKLREFSKINFVFVIQDKINSTLAIVEDCLEINNVCFLEIPIISANFFLEDFLEVPRLHRLKVKLFG